MTGRALPRVVDPDLSTWAAGAVIAAVLGGIVNTLVLASAEHGALNWPLIVLPVALVPTVLLCSRAMRLLGATAMAGWCAITTFSLGPAFLPCLLLMFGAAMAEDA